LPALVRGLGDTDVQVRRNVALFLFAGADWSEKTGLRDCQACLSALIQVLGDPDTRVRELAAHAVGGFGAKGAPAVPALIRLLKYPDEGSRNTACIGLRSIGPAAKDALPALRDALSDPSADVRVFARRAIESIEQRQP
jgi:HEAT repeat protein